MRRFEIELNGRKFPAAEVIIYRGTPKERTEFVSTAELSGIIEDAIENDCYMGEIVNADKSFTFYVEEDDLLSMSEERLVGHIEYVYDNIKD